MPDKEFEIYEDGVMFGHQFTSTVFDDMRLVCIGCGTKQDGLTGTTTGAVASQEEEAIVPTPGSIVVCSYCGAINQLDEDLKMKSPDPAILESFNIEELEMLKKMQSMYKDRPITQQRSRYEQN